MFRWVEITLNLCRKSKIRIRIPLLIFDVFSEEYEIDHLKNIFDNFVLGGGIQQTQENPLQLALVNNNSDAGSVLVKKEVL